MQLMLMLQLLLMNIMEILVECFQLEKHPVKLNNLIDTTYESMMRAIKILKPGIRLGDIGYEIQSFVEEKGFSVVRDFCGHGISTTFHEPPNILTLWK